MLEVHSTLDFLIDDPLYRTERPYIFTPAGGVMVDSSHPTLNTVRLADVPVTLSDIRDAAGFTLGTAGFEKTDHTTRIDLKRVQDVDVRDQYREETAAVLKQYLKAEHVYYYNVKTRKNVVFDPEEKVDLLDRLAPELAALGIHDFLMTGSQIHEAGYRFRVVNTWRPLLPVIEDRPLAFCAFRSIDPADMVVADRIFPHETFELYFVKHNPSQRWHWLSKQRQSELILMLMDSQAGGARFCPHGSFVNPLAGPDSPPRESVETRSIVIGKCVQ
ncbi:hypothetical protein BDV96DRAFT_690861 [Lophiotrema nucula]|uniref:Methyltransferase n=1 Tax=Lophiotrema nucula TaxID=690887 RepID=A0A6A5YY39_9PLEO|nr:hypothetical protein BDV96DRAFT_690861 [Lophiotrema nucula]